jgi:hypothetical protein
MNKNTKLMILAAVIIVIFLAAWYLLFQSVPQGPEPQPFVSNITVLSSMAAIPMVYML